jgi:RNA polymerase sigma-70 factor (ECF subfamily)
VTATSDRGEKQSALAERIERIVCDARKRWTGIRCGAGEFLEHLALLDGGTGDLDRFGHELFLACACCRYDASALRVLNSDYIARLPRKFLTFPSGSDFADDVIQELRQRLLLPPEPRLSRYTATGPLLRWLNVVASRLAIDLRRSIRRDEREGPSFAIAHMVHPSVDTAEVQRYAPAIGATIRQAFLRLTWEERNLLRLYHLQGISLDRLASLNGVHRATVARWLSEIRHRLLVAVEAEVSARHKLTRSELLTVLRGVQAHIDTDDLWTEFAETQ